MLKKELIYPGGINCRICDLYFKEDKNNYKYLCVTCREYLDANEEEDYKSPEVHAIILASGRTKPVFYEE